MALFEQISIGLISFVIFILIHILVWQFEVIKFRGVLLIWKIATLCFFFIILFIYFFYNISIENHVWTSSPLYLCLIMLYTHLYVGIDKSISIRIMGELASSNKKVLIWEDIEKIYSPYTMVKTRLDLLVEKEWLEMRDDKYHYLPKAEKLVRINLYLQKLFLLEKTG